MKNWEALAERSGRYAAADFQMAAYALMTQQALYAVDARQRTAYHLIKDHLAHYREVFELFGVDIIDEGADQYLVAVPRSQRLSQLSTEMTLLILTLAQVYRQQVMRGELDGDRAVVTIEELRSAYRAMSGRELTGEAGSLRQLLTQTQRMGMARTVDSEVGSGQPFDVAVLPAIKSLVSESVLMRMGAEYQAVASIASGDAEVQEAPEEDADEAA